MQVEYMHINYSPASASGVLRLWTRLMESSSLTLRQRWENLQGTETSELAVAHSTKLEMLREIVRRLDEELSELGDSLANDASGDVDKCIVEGYAYTLPNPRFAYRLIADLDSFLYHTKSACELMARFAVAFSRDILGQRPAIKLIKDEYFQFLADSKTDMGWYDVLETLRNLFIHNTAPWLAVTRVTSQPAKFDLILFKRNIHTFDDPNEWVGLDEYRRIFKGFQESLPVFLRWLGTRIDEFEKRDAAGQR